MIRQFRMWTAKQASAVSRLLRVWIVRYISTILTWRKDIDNLLSNIQSTLRFIYWYPLTFSTWRSSCNFIPVYYLFVLYRSQLGYFSSEGQSCTFVLQFYITDISITLYTRLFLVLSLTKGVDPEESNTIRWSPKRARGTNPTAWWFEGYFC